jgi:hypothetical protein
MPLANTGRLVYAGKDMKKIITCFVLIVLSGFLFVKEANATDCNRCSTAHSYCRAIFTSDDNCQTPVGAPKYSLDYSCPAFENNVMTGEMGRMDCLDGNDSDVGPPVVNANEIPNLKNLQFALKTGKTIASLNGKWYAKPEKTTIEYKPILVPGFWQRRILNMGNWIRNLDNQYPEWGKGPIIYALKFSLPDNLLGESFNLHFKGASSSVETYINNQLVGTHVGNHDPFSMQINGSVMKKENLLTLRVTDNNDGVIYGDPIGWPKRDFGGIYEDVVMEVRRPIDKVRVLTPTLNSLDVTLDITNYQQTASNYSLSVEIIDKVSRSIVWKKEYENQLSFTPGEHRVIKWNIQNISGVKNWSPEFPKLYTVSLTLKQGGQLVDTLERDTGFKTFTVSADGKKFVLNGEKYFLKGINWPMDPTSYLLDGNPSHPYITEGLKALKDAGVNAIRIFTEGQVDFFLEEADRQGFIIYYNLPTDWMTTNIGNAEFIRKWKLWNKAVIDDISYHPSVSIYSVANEWILFDPANDQIRTVLDNMVSDLRINNDPTRLYLTDGGCMSFKSFQSSSASPPSVFSGSNFADICGSATDMTDTHWYYLDATYNTSDPFIYGSGLSGALNSLTDFDTALNKLLSFPSTKPLVFSEYGGPGSDDQGNMWLCRKNINNCPYLVDLKNKGLLTSGSLKLPDDASAYQAYVARKLTETLISKKDATRLAGVFYFEFLWIFYNPYNITWDQIKHDYLQRYLCTPDNHDTYCYSESNWVSHQTLELKPAYYALKDVYTSMETSCNRCSSQNGCERTQFLAANASCTQPISGNTVIRTTDCTCPQISGGNNARCTAECVPSNTLSPTPTSIPGDIWGPAGIPDGHVDMYDFDKMRTSFGSLYTLFDYNDLVGNFGI